MLPPTHSFLFEKYFFERKNVIVNKSGNKLNCIIVLKIYIFFMSRKVGKSINILFYFYSKIITDFAIKIILFQCGRSKKF